MFDKQNKCSIMIQFTLYNPPKVQTEQESVKKFPLKIQKIVEKVGREVRCLHLVWLLFTYSLHRKTKILKFHLSNYV